MDKCKSCFGIIIHPYITEILLVPLSDNIDLFVGGMAETPYLGSAKIGMTFLCIMVDQFTRLRDGDR